MKERLRQEFLKWKFGMFIHFGVGTFNNRDWANGYEDPDSFAPSNLDCDQWAESAKAAGMKYAVFTTKHTGGWCLWNTSTTASHGMANFKRYKEGRGDIVREFVDAFRKHGIKIGLYYCFPGDYTGGEDGCPLPPDKDDLHGLPPEAKGDYTGFIKRQFTELLTQYGNIDLLWADQFMNGYTGKDWLDIKNHIKSHQADCIVIANNSLDDDRTDIHSYEYPYLCNVNPQKSLPPMDNQSPAEVCDILGPKWFWTEAENSANTKSAEDILQMLRLCNARNANYLLNVAPDRFGRIPEHSAERLNEVGRLREHTKQKNTR